MSTTQEIPAASQDKRLPRDGYYPLRVVGAWPSLEAAAETNGRELHPYEAGVIAYLEAGLWFADTPDANGAFTVAYKTSEGRVLMMLGVESAASPSPNAAYEAGFRHFGEEGWPFVIIEIGQGIRPATH